MTCYSVECFVQQFTQTDPQTNYVSLIGTIDNTSILEMIRGEIQKRKTSISNYGKSTYKAINHTAQNQVNNTRLKQYELQEKIILQKQEEQAAAAAAEAERAARAEKPATISIYNKQAQDIAKADDKNDLFKLAAIYAAISLLG